MIAALLARPAMALYLAGLLAIGAWGLYQSHQLGRAEMAREMAVTQRDQWQAKAEKVQLEIAQTRVMLRTCSAAVE
jgi:hypothetical protein